MSRNAIVREVLIASPGDVGDARGVFAEAVYDWNAAHSRESGVVLLPVRWETHAYPEMGDRPQALINKQIVDGADVLIGAFWTRLGTDTGEAPSGTAEEIERFRRAGKPILLYFSEQPVVPSSIDMPEYARLQEFKATMRSAGVYWEYASLEDLRAKATRHLAKAMAGMSASADPGSVTIAAELRDTARSLQAKWRSVKDGPERRPDAAANILSAASNAFLAAIGRVPSRESQRVPEAIREAARGLSELSECAVSARPECSEAEFWDRCDGLLAHIQKAVSGFVEPLNPEQLSIRDGIVAELERNVAEFRRFWDRLEAQGAHALNGGIESAFESTTIPVWSRTLFDKNAEWLAALFNDGQIERLHRVYAFLANLQTYQAEARGAAEQRAAANQWGADLAHRNIYNSSMEPVIASRLKQAQVRGGNAWIELHRGKQDLLGAVDAVKPICNIVRI